ncbi:3-oxoacyl-[acyl-carrier-protein] synthase III C-terminal domain-containing protein [uncultured Roseibium sp.]|uniref:3-oxoacyl-[acyl-carrier-protein] synthase III C-terminal domain-containing protein n=1 Tax=uncultured Roseibium sp. TaxID=1936171 RepID=UPI0032180D49
MTGITAIGAYLPRARLSRSAIADAMGWLTPGLPRKGSRTLGFWDEDATTMGVAAARTCLAQPGQEHAPASLDFCTLTPAFAERQNASILHAALRLPVTCLHAGKRHHRTCLPDRATPVACLRRAGACWSPPTVPVTSPGSAAEGRMGDGGAAVAVNTGPELLSYLGGVSLTSAMTERYRAPGAPFATEWEDRWVREEGWQTLAVAAIEAALREANLAPDAVDHLVLATTQPRLAGLVARTAGLNKARLADDLGAGIGDTASAQGLMMLAAAVGTIRPGETVLLAGLGQGATTLLFRATEDIKQARTGFAESRDAGLSETNYTKLPFFNGLLSWDPRPAWQDPGHGGTDHGASLFRRSAFLDGRALPRDRCRAVSAVTHIRQRPGGAHGYTGALAAGRSWWARCVAHRRYIGLLAHFRRPATGWWIFTAAVG